MTTIRGRLTLWYTVALGVTVLAFGALLYLERRQSTLRELDQRLGLEADLAKRWLSESYNVLGRIVTTAGSSPSLDPGISAYLEAVRDYLVVSDTLGNVLAPQRGGADAQRRRPAAAHQPARFAPPAQARRHIRPRTPGPAASATWRCGSRAPAPRSAACWSRPPRARSPSVHPSCSGRCC